MKKTVRFALIIAVGLVLVGGILGAMRLATGKSIGLRSWVTHLTDNGMSAVRAVIDHKNTQKQARGEYTSVIFLHHSVGRGIISQGNLRAQLSQSGMAFYDHDYNDPGLTLPDGQPAGYSYRVPDDNTDIGGLVRIFRQKIYPLPFNTMSSLFQHEVIIVKSCFPNNAIASDDQLAQDQKDYLEIRKVMESHPDKLFILLTTPPLNPAETNLEQAARARTLANWLASEQFKNGADNIFVFDLFDQLADQRATSSDYNQLRVDYRNGSDSHPNQLANEKLGSLLAKFVETSIQQYRATRAQ